MFAGDCSVEIGDGILCIFHDARQAVEAFEAIELFAVAEAGGIQSVAEDGERFVVGLERNREGVAVFSSVGKRESRGIGEAGGSAVDDFGDERQGLQSARAETFNEKERRKIAKFLAMRHSQHRAKAFEVDIGRADIVMSGHYETADLIERNIDILRGDGEKRFLRRSGARIDEIEDGALRLADNGGVWLASEIANAGRVPVIAASEARGGIHALLDHSPLARTGDDEGMEIELEAVRDGVVIDARSQAAGASQILSVEASGIAEREKFDGSFCGVLAATAAKGETEFGGARIQATFEGTENGSSDSRRVPIHAHYATESLKPERITQASENF